MRELPHLGLRARITLIYTLGALLIASTVAYSGFALVRRELLADTEASAEAQMWRNAASIRRSLGNQSDEAIELALIPLEDRPETDESTLDIQSLLNELLKPNNALELLVLRDQARSSSALQIRNIPDELEELVLSGEGGKIRFRQSGQPRYASGVFIAQLDAQYYEVVNLQPLQETLDRLRNILIGVAIVASGAGAALGYSSSRRALQPVAEVSSAAQAIAAGDFGTRLDNTVDPDLAPLTSSFNEMVGALEARIERDERFASDVSHELRSPLMTLAASIGVLEHRRDELSTPAQQAVDLLGKDLRRFTRLVEDLLEISRMDAGAVEADLSPVFLAEFLRFAVQQTDAPDVPVRFLPEDEELVILADKRRMAQVIKNLVSNATKYGGGATSVSFLRNSIDTVHIYVDDNGPGIAPEDRARVFERFARAGADAGRRDIAKGVGLGLSLVSEHLRLQGGKIWVTDRENGRPGARFVIEMSLFDPEELDEEFAE